jgi:hypothetical protein
MSPPYLPKIAGAILGEAQARSKMLKMDGFMIYSRPKLILNQSVEAAS